MAAPLIREAVAPADGLSRACGASVAVGDCVIVFTWEMSGTIPTHTLQTDYTQILTGTYDEGSTDGRLSIAFRTAVTAGVQTYQAYTSSAGTTTMTGLLVLQAGTWETAFANWVVATPTMDISNAVGNPPPVTLGATKDWLVCAGEAVRSANTGWTLSQITNYTEQWEYGGAGAGDLCLNTRVLAPGAGVEDPGTISDNQAPTGTVAFTFAIPNPSGPPTHFGAVSLPMTFDRSIAGSKQTFSNLSLPMSFNRVVAGSRKTFSGLALPVTFGAAVEGKRKVFGQLALPLIFSKEIAAQRKTFGQLSSPFIFGKAVVGQRQTFGQIAFPINIALAVAGVRVGFTHYGSLAFPIIFAKDVRGQRKAFGQLSLPITFTKEVSARRTTFGQLVFPIVFTKEAAGVKTLFGQLSMQTLFGKETVGLRKTFGQFAMPITFSKAVIGRKQTFGQVAFPIQTLIYVDGYGWVGAQTYYGQLEMPLTFNKQVSAQRKTFGQISAPFLFGATSQAQRRTFGKVELPLDFEAAVKSGPVGVHGALDLGLVLSMNTDGKIKLYGIILNDALDLYLGEEDVVAVYVGNEQVWP